jgi:hypothetical protein
MMSEPAREQLTGASGGSGAAGTSGVSVPFADELAVGFVDGEFEDGNALAGPLSELFAVDIVSAEGRCTGCGTTGPVAQLRVYGPGPGLVARCPECGQVVLRLVRGAESAWLDLRGTVSLRFRLGTDR